MAAMAASDSLVSHNFTNVLGPKCYLQVQILTSQECTFSAEVGASVLLIVFDQLETIVKGFAHSSELLLLVRSSTV